MSVLGLGLLTSSAFAQDVHLNRREGFLLLWETVKRQAEETRDDFSDILDDSPGGLEINYARDRGILPDASELFSPDEPLLLRDALLWLYRTRNIRELPDMQEEHLPSMMEQYSVIDPGADLSVPVTKKELSGFISSLDGLLRKEVHEISNYGLKFHGDGTAFGETFDMHALTAAHRSYPHDTLVNVTNVENGKSVIVRINDRGPYVEGRDMDLSTAAFDRIASRDGQGVLMATFERLGDKDLVDPCEGNERFYQRRITRRTHFFRGIPQTFTVGEKLILQSTDWFLVNSITFPDGEKLRIQDFVGPGEKFHFTPEASGTHIFHVGDGRGRNRDMKMEVRECSYQP